MPMSIILSSGLLKKGCAEQLSPSAGCVRVSLTYIIFHYLPRKWVVRLVERVFPQPTR